MLQMIRAWGTKQKKRGQELEEHRRQSAEAVRDARATAAVAERQQFEPDRHEESE
jgi:hypothetical protein